MKYEPQPNQDANSEPSPDETLMGYSTRLGRQNHITRNMFQEIHRKVHYCCYGAATCYICPMWDAIDSLTSSNIELSNILKKKGFELIYSWNPKRTIGKWKLVPTRT